MWKHWPCNVVINVLMKEICKKIHFINFWSNVSVLTRLSCIQLFYVMQNFFLGCFFWNEIVIFTYTYFLLETLKTTFKMRNLTQDGHNQGIFFQTLSTFFQLLKKGRGDPAPCPPSSYAPGSALKSPKVIKLSYFEDCELRFFPMSFKWFFISAYCGLYKQLINHLVFLMLISVNIACIKVYIICFLKVDIFSYIE